MIRRASAPAFLLGAAAAVCAVLVLGALGGRDTSWTIVVLPLVAFLAGRAPARPAGALAVGLLLGGVAAGEIIHFDDNVLVQIKYGPIDFQVREPVSPLIAALKHTNETIAILQKLY